MVYGTDDRRDVYEEEDAVFRSLATDTALMIMRVGDVQSSAGSLTFDSSPLGKAYGLCPGERFFDQPSVGFCSGTLVEPDLVLTAGHCTLAVPCEEWAIVRGFQYDAPPTLKALQDADLGYCAEVIASHVDAETEGRRLDYAWVRLDRPFEGTGALPRLDRRILEKDAAIVAIGHPTGLPTKIDDGGRVQEPRAATGDYFVTSTDTFVGDSGAGVFDEHGRLRGIAVRGAGDFVLTKDGCRQTESLDARYADEKATYVGPALDALCARDGSRGVCDGWRPPRQPASCSMTARRHDATGYAAGFASMLLWTLRRRVIARRLPCRAIAGRRASRRRRQRRSPDLRCAA